MLPLPPDVQAALMILRLSDTSRWTVPISLNVGTRTFGVGNWAHGFNGGPEKRELSLSMQLLKGPRHSAWPDQAESLSCFVTAHYLTSRLTP
jgi:hypothetical protein